MKYFPVKIKGNNFTGKIKKEGEREEKLALYTDLMELLWAVILPSHNVSSGFGFVLFLMKEHV